MPFTVTSERIAIVGVGGIFPGASNLETFWQNIAQGVDSGRTVPEGRWYLSPDKAYAPWPPQPDRVYSTWGCFIEGFSFDPEGIDLPPEILAGLDPMFHLGLDAARAAYRDAGQLTGIDSSRVGVILGNIALPTESTSAICRDVLGRTFVERLIDAAAAAKDRDQKSEQGCTRAPCATISELKSSLRRSDWHPWNRFAAGLPASLIAQGLGLGGLAFTLDAACASSLYSLKFAAEELLSHRADAMLAGGMSRPDCQYTQMGFAQLKALTRRGRCAPLSAQADGLVVGEGAGVFVLKRLRDAVASGDHIYGVIAGIGLSNDRGANLLAPHSEGQLRAMRDAYRQAGWKPSDVDLIECHATGTPVGDAVEISSLHQLWKQEEARPHQCVIGGVKSNVGHLLTGAGAAGLMKVLLALKHQTHPPTANFTEPAEELASPESPFHVLRESMPWGRRSNSSSAGAGQPVPRRATINAFGFGGINAHVLIEEWIGVVEAANNRSVSSARSPSTQAAIAVVGVQAHLGGLDSKQAVMEHQFPSKALDLVPLNWWGVERSDWFAREVGRCLGSDLTDGLAPQKTEEPEDLRPPLRRPGTYRDAGPVGSGITEVRLPMGPFRIPPVEMQEMLPQQQLMLKVVNGALRDSVALHSASSHNVAQGSDRTGVFVGIELDPNTTNFHFRWAIEQDAAAWAQMLELDLSTEEMAEWIAQLKDAAGPPLSPNGVMGNLGGIVASRLAREFDVGGPSFTISCGGDSGRIAFELAAQFLQSGELDAAIVGGVEFGCDVRTVITEARQLPSEVNDDLSAESGPLDGAIAFVLRRQDDARRMSDRIYATLRPTTDVPCRVAHSPNNAVQGFLFQRSTFVMESILNSVLSAYYRPRSTMPLLIDRSTSDEECGRAITLVRGFEIKPADQTSNPSIAAERFGNPGDGQTGLFVVSGLTQPLFLEALDELEQCDNESGSCEAIARTWHRRHGLQTNEGYLAAFVATDQTKLKNAIRELRNWANRGCPPNDIQSRNVFATDSHSALSGPLAFVFPGSGSGFPGMGREVLAAFPAVLEQQARENKSLEEQFHPQLIWSREEFPKLALDHKAMIFSQVAIGTAICDLLALFGIRPAASIGYSLGESSALFGLKAWTDRDEMLQRMEMSSLFGSDLVAPFDAARKAWNVSAGEPVLWLSGLIDRSATDVRSAIERIQMAEQANGRSLRVYLLIVNTPRQCVIGGDHRQLRSLVEDLNARFVPFGSPSTVHCDVLRNVEAAYRELHLMRTTAPWVDNEHGFQSPIRFYSTAWGRAYDVTRELAAAAIVAQAVDTIDFPRVIEQAYADGIRRFLEIGPGSSCTKMIDEILGDRPHWARSVLPMTSRSLEAFYEVLAALIVERLPVDLTYLYGSQTPDPASETAKPPLREVVTRVGGTPFQIPNPPNGWRFVVPPVVVEPPPIRVQNVDVEEFVNSELVSVYSTNGISRLESNHLEAPVVEEAAWEHRPESVHVPEPRHEQPIALTDGGGSLNLMEQFQLMIEQSMQAHQAYLRFTTRAEHMAAEQLALLAQVGGEPPDSTSTSSYAATSAASVPPLVPAVSIRESNDFGGGDFSLSIADEDGSSTLPPLPATIPDEPRRSLNRQQCMEFAIGKIGRVLGKKFAEIDQHPTRVRLPDEPLMLVDRILTIEGEPLSMTSGRVVTEHDIHPGAWYLDCGRIPTCIAVESGQADLFLSGWLGIDLQTKGIARYRLLDAVVTFHDALPQAGKTIRYDIRVLHFFRQGDTCLFRFEFDATVDGQPLLTMREGCAGFFTDAELAGGKGIIHTALDKRPRPGIRPANWSDPVPLAVESYDDNQILALRRGDMATCFGSAFSDLPLSNPVTIPGLMDLSGSSRSRMWLIDRVLKLDPVGGKFGMGTILGELDIHPDDWFLTCHFCDDQVMPGTLMYECCLHTLRIFLLRMGWIGEAGQIAYEPIPGIRSRLKCRGQVLAGTKKVWYEVTLKELGYGERSNEGKVMSNESKGYAPSVSSLLTPDSSLPSAYCLADALMYADGKPIVEITDMSVRLTGLTQEAVERLWAGGRTRIRSAVAASMGTVRGPVYDRRKPIFDTDRITAFAVGKPSDAFGDRYRVFDEDRKIARLPGPPFQFLDRVVSIENCQPWVLQQGGEIVAQYDVPVDAWYFASNRQPTMPFAVLLETALQPCGWLAGYLGSALTSDIDLSFRNLGGTAVQYRDVTAQSGTLTTTVKMTRVSNSAGMIIQHYDFDLRCQGEPVYVGNTYFGFFSKAALSNQIGIRDAAVYQPTAAELAHAKRGLYPDIAPFPDQNFRMIRTVECLIPNGGTYGQGCIVGKMPVDQSSWFFKAHFYQDPVVPGSLGLESFWQLLKVYAVDRWQLGSDTQFATPSLVPGDQSSTPSKHEWVYRGQVIPKDDLVTVTAVIRIVDDAKKLVTGEGFLSVDGRVIYQMKEFTLGVI